MANRYWRGGTGTWDASNTANWSATSGGAGGASAPTLADDVFFDAGSDAGGIFTVTIGTGAVCRDITVAGLDQVMTLAGSAAWSIYGSLAFPATNLTSNYTGIASFQATSTGKTITTNGVNTPNEFRFNSASGEWTLGSALTSINGIRMLNGVFNTNNFNLTLANISASGAGSAQMNLGSSIITLTLSAPVTMQASGIVLNADTSSIVCSSASPTLAGAGLTFNNVSFTSTSAGTATITGANTFNNLTFTSLAATGLRNINLGANQTVNGTLTLGTANTAIRRMFMFSDVIGTPRTITANAIAALSDVDLRDIVAAGASGTWSGTRLGNCLGNGNITFDAGKTVYWNLAGGGNFSSTAWALSSGGAVSASNFPLAQDSIVFEDTGLNSGVIVYTGWNWNIGGINTSSRTLPMWLDFVAINLYKNIAFHSGLSVSGTGVTTFAGQGTTQQIASAGRPFTQGLIVNSVTGTLQLQDALTTSGAFTLTSGTLDLNSNNLTALTFGSNNSNVRSIAFGTGSINLTGNSATVWNCDNLTNFTLTGIPNVNLTYSGSTGTRLITHGRNPNTGDENNAVSINVSSGSDVVNTQASLTGSKFKNIDLTGFLGIFGNSVNETRVMYGDLIIPATVTVAANVGGTSFSKSSGIQTITTNGKTLDLPIVKRGAGTLQLTDNLTQGVTRIFTHEAGTVDLNDNDLTAGLWSSAGAVARHLDTGATGELHISGATFTASGSNLTTSGTGLISMDSASAKTFAGGGFSWPILNQGGAGDLNLTGANRFKDMTNTVAPCAVVFPANVTTQVENFSLNGTPDNVVSIRSSVAGQRFGLDKVAA